MKRKLLTILSLATGYVTTAQTINIPDPIFEQVLINQEIDSDGIVNGMILTADALAVTELDIDPYIALGANIGSLTGIEAFINLESLKVNRTEIEELNVNTLNKLKYLDCPRNMLSSIDLSNNILLEELIISIGDDVYPLNQINVIDLSNNPNIKKIVAQSVYRINLKNGNNTTDMLIDVNGFFMGGGPEPEGYICIEVDDAVAASNNQPPYSDWNVSHWYKTLTYSENCSLSADAFNKNTISIYPNPATDVLHIVTTNGSRIEKAVLYDLSGRIVKEYNAVSESISVSGLQKGIYMMQVFSGNETQSQKIIVN